LKLVEATKKDGLKAMFHLMDEDEIAKVDAVILAILSETDEAELKGFLKPGETVASLKTLSRGEVASRFAGLMGQIAPQLSDVMRKSECRILGHVMEGNVAHVVVKWIININGADVEIVDVASFRRSGENWKASLKGEILAALQAGAKSKKKGLEKSEKK